MNSPTCRMAWPPSPLSGGEIAPTSTPCSTSVNSTGLLWQSTGSLPTRPITSSRTSKLSITCFWALIAMKSRITFSLPKSGFQTSKCSGRNMNENPQTRTTRSARMIKWCRIKFRSKAGSPTMVKSTESVITPTTIPKSHPALPTEKSTSLTQRTVEKTKSFPPSRGSQAMTPKVTPSSGTLTKSGISFQAVMMEK